MEDIYLREFIDLAETCNFQESAENMCISASSLSKHIQKMEGELGVPLFNRSTRTVSLNKYGEILLSYAKQIISLTDQYHSDLHSALTIERSQLNIGFFPMLGRFGILEILSEFTEQHPNVTMNVIEGFQLEELLLEKQYDFVFVDAYGPKDSRISKILLKKDHLVAIFPEEHPFASKEEVTISELRNENFLLQVSPDGKPTITSQNFISLCQKEGFQPCVTLNSRHISTIARMVESGKGIAILNSSEIRDERNFHYSVVDIIPIVPFEIYISFVPSHIRTDTACAFLEFLQERYKQNE